MNYIIRQVLNIVAVLAVIGFNGLANSLPLNGQTTGQVANRFDIYFMPAGYAFSIWGLIYLGLIAFAVYQVRPSQRDNSRLRRIDVLFWVSSLANIAWLVCWHYELFGYSVLAMLILLLSLIGIYQALEIGRTRVPLAEKWLVHVPFSIYLAWVSVATIANVAVLLDYLNWNGGGLSPVLWTVILLVVALAIGTAVSLPRADAAYLLVLVWSFIAIAVMQSEIPLVMITAIVTAIIAFILALGALITGRQNWLPRPA